MKKSLGERLSFERIRYANCWEDAEILCDALLGEADLRPRGERGGGRILSIASGGDNAFALLAAGADQVVAADLSAAQLAVVELKAAAIRRLDRLETRRFLGVDEARGASRQATYSRLEGDLSAEARAFWRENRELIAAGLVHQGKFERYFNLFRRFVLPLVHRGETVRELMRPRDPAERRRFYDEVWDTRRWRFIFRLFFSRAVMGRLGRDPELFRFVRGPVADRILERCRHALTELPTHENPYLEYILTGSFERTSPLYLRPRAYERLGEILRADPQRLLLARGDVAEVGRRHAGEHGFDGFNLSDIFEYLDEPSSAELYRSLLEVARPGARFAYWNLLAPRRRPEALRCRVERLPQGLRLHQVDRAFFYSAFHVEARRC